MKHELQIRLLTDIRRKLKIYMKTIINIEMPFLQDKNANIILKNIKILLAKTEKYILDESAKL